MTVRITGGVHRGRRLRLPRSTNLRPTSDRVRSAVFSILGADSLQDTLALDLYAGSGVLGLEALSRGAAGAVFVEADARRCRHIRDALEALGLADRVSVHNGRVERVLGTLTTGGFGVAFADPPYALTDWQPLMGLLNRAGLLAEGAVVVAEHRHDTGLADEYGGLALLTRRRYGDTTISIYAKSKGLERIDG